MSSNTNFATWNPLTIGTRSGLTNGNTTLSSITTADLAGGDATMGITTGKYYWEIYIHDNGSGYIWSGLSSGYEGGGFYSGYSDVNGMTPGAIRLRNNGTLDDSSAQDDPDRWGTITLTSTGVSTYTDGDIMMYALDYDNKKLWIGKNGTFFNSGNPAAGSNQQASWDGDVPIIYPNIAPYYPGTPNNGGTVNFGQDSSFAGNKTSGSAAATDGNGYGDFYYTPPTDYLSLNSANAPISDDIDPAQTDDSYPGKNFNGVLYTGNGSASAKTIDGFNFSPDFIWVKSRSGAKNNMLVDNSRGGDKYMYSNAQNAELTASNMITFGNSDGYVMRDDGTYLNENSGSYVAWGWRANGGTTSSDSSGDITVTRQTNTAGGFSILTYTGNGSSDQTIAHGLGKSPAFIITKNRSSSSHWAVWHHRYTGYYGQLESTGAFASDSSQFYTAGMTSNFIGVKGSGATNESGDNMLAYVWSEIDGYSKFGTYTGNYSANGPFVYTGFRPRMLFVKRADGTNSWFVWDTTRTTFNKMNSYLYWDLTNAEETGYAIDVLSNGFKIRGQNNATNNSGGIFVYGAWGDVPFKYNNTF